MNRTLLLFAGLGLAIGVPYLLSNAGGDGSILERLQALRPAPAAATEEAPAAEPAKPAADSKMPRLAGPPVADMGEIFRFDVTTAWVLSRWPRVSTRLAQVDLQGYRVPLVTGTREDDLAGSLTYYFGTDQRVEVISFNGTTGDARRLVKTLALKHQFVREPMPGPGRYVYRVKDGRETLSELLIEPAEVVTVSDPLTRFRVALVMQRPRS